MTAERLSGPQHKALKRAVLMQIRRNSYERLLSEAVSEALELDVPVNRLARCLSVSRSRIRILGRQA